MSHAALDHLLAQESLRHTLWRGRQHGLRRPSSEQLTGQATGYVELDQALPDGGWPKGALIEILHNAPGQGEFAFMLPMLAALSQAQKRIVLLDPPWLACAPALTMVGLDLAQLMIIRSPEPHGFSPSESLWALEQTLRSGHVCAVVAWPEQARQQTLSTTALRRLQLAAEKGEACGFLFRQSHLRRQHSPAAVRLHYTLQKTCTTLEIFKCRGRTITQPIHIQNPFIHTNQCTGRPFTLANT